MGFRYVILALLAAQLAIAGTPYPPKASANNRYLVDASGNPWLMVGDSPQSLIANVSTANGDMQTYFDNRATNGMNAAYVMLILGDYTFGSTNLTAQDGSTPFTNTVAGGWPDLTTPREAYWTNVDFMFRCAGSNGICILANPCETGYFDYSHPVMSINGSNNMWLYGNWVGNRYKNTTNLIWHCGNDFVNWTTTTNSGLNAALIRGILSADTNHLVTTELTYDSDTLADSHLYGSLSTMDAAYVYMTTYALIGSSYARTNPLPVFLTEAHYENENIFEFGTALDLRKQFYWTLLAGGTGGHLWGSSNTVRMANWKNSGVLYSQGTREYSYGINFFTNRQWYGLAPDTTSRFVVSGRGTSNSTDQVSVNDYVTAAMTSGGTLGIAYLPASNSITASLTNFNGMVTARWFDPTTNTFTAIAGSPFGNTSNKTFTVPGNNAAGSADWVLLLESNPLNTVNSIGKATIGRATIGK